MPCTASPGPRLRTCVARIELSPENRLLARQEADFDAIRDSDEFQRILESPPPDAASSRAATCRALRHLYHTHH